MVTVYYIARPDNPNLMEVTELMGKWVTAVADDLHMPYMKNIAGIVKRDEKVLQPSMPNIFRALRLTSPDDVKLVILGQDPYHTGADGLAFSSAVLTPSLQVIFERLRIELGVERTRTDLTDWAEQGILLLNTVLTTRTGTIGAHTDIGWQLFTRKLIQYLLTNYDRIVFLIWGTPAREFMAPLTHKRDHLLLYTYYPEAEKRVANTLFRPQFYRATEYLEAQKIKPIIWSPSVGVLPAQSTW